jgi:hypothetical protein
MVVALKSRQTQKEVAMPQGEQFRIGAEVTCTDGGEVCGQIRYLDIDRDSHALTFLAVEEEGRMGLGRLVPLDDDHVHIDPGTHEIQFRGSMARFQELDPADVTTFVTGTAAWERYGEEQVVEKPEYDPVPGEQVEGSSVPGFEPVTTADVVPGGDVEIGRHCSVHAGSHEFGRVHGVVTDPGHTVTHVLLGEWHGLQHKEVAVPFGGKDMINDDGFHFSMSKQEIEDLPPAGQQST